MKAVQVTEWGQSPKCIEVSTPAIPPADSPLLQIKLLAAGLHQLVRLRATGRHYSSGNLPHTLGSDGVGTTQDGQLVYFNTFATGGSFSEFVNVPKKNVTVLPEGIDPVQVAGLLNPAASSWMALRTRRKDLPPNFSVLILGATSTSGTTAISLARALGAGKIIGCARNTAALAALQLDEAIPLLDPIAETDFSKADNVDVVLDYLYGEPALHLLKSLKPTTPVQFIHLGSLSSPDMTIPGELLRSKDVTIRGSAPGSYSFKTLEDELPGLLKAVGSIKPHKFKVVSLSEVESNWDNKRERMVVVP